MSTQLSHNSSTGRSSRRRDQPQPKRDPACENCTAPVTQQHYFVQDSKDNRYTYGEIIGIDESVHAPIDRLFAGPLTQPRAAASSSTLSRHGKVRPAVVLGGRNARGSNENPIRLMATFEGIYKLDDLPLVLQHFCMPISPHYEIGVDVEHLHTTPEWQKAHGWLILPPCVSSGEMFGRWNWKDENNKHSEDCSFKVDTAVLSQLENIYTRRFKEWSAKCSAEEGYREERCKEYQTFKSQGSAKSGRRQSGSPFVRSVPITPRSGPSVHASPDKVLSQSLPTNIGVPPPFSSPSHSRHTSASGILVFGDAPLPDLDPGNRLGVTFAPTTLPGVEGWLSALPLDLDAPGESFAPRDDLDTTSTTSTKSVHDDSVPKDVKRSALEDATVTLSQQGAPPNSNVNESPVTTDNHQASRGDLPTFTPAQPAATPACESPDSQSPAEGSSTKLGKNSNGKLKRLWTSVVQRRQT